MALVLNHLLDKTGKPIVLNDQEERIARHCESQIQNSLGFEVPITTLTGIFKKVSEQKFATLSIPDYLPISNIGLELIVQNKPETNPQLWKQTPCQH